MNLVDSGILLTDLQLSLPRTFPQVMRAAKDNRIAWIRLCAAPSVYFKTLSEVHRVLKTDGFFLVSHMTNDPRELPTRRALPFHAD